MAEDNNNCLFEKWQAGSAPSFHTSGFWPTFNEAAIHAYLAGSGDGPQATKPLNEPAVRATKQAIESFLESIRSVSETDIPCKSAYIDYETERLVLLNLILSAESAPEKLNHYNDQLYGKLSDLHATEALQYVKYSIGQLEPKSNLVAIAQKQLLDFWQDVPASDTIVEQFRMFDAHRQLARPLVEHNFSFLKPLMLPYAGKTSLDSESVRDILDQSLSKILGEDRSDWQAHVKDGAPNVFIDNDAHAIIIPAGRQYGPNHINSLVVHEIGVHVARAVHGGSSRERLASCGMAGYGPTEEAFGVLLGSAADAGYNPLSSFVGFAVMDFASRLKAPTFRQIHDLTTALLLCLADPGEDAARQNAADYQRRAFARVIRMFRLGTARLVERSTTKYWRGIVLLNQYLNQHPLNETTLREFLLGKYDCLNETQLRLIKTHTTL